MRKVSRRVLPCLFIVAALGGARAEGALDSAFPRLSSALPVEAPSSIFDAKLGDGPDADAQLLVSGSWSATLLSSLDFQSTRGSALSLSTSQPILFTQDPSLALSFLLYKKIFVDAEVSSDIAKAKYSAGYRGGEGELVREFRLGNDSISFPSLPYLSFGSGSYRSFGASLLVGDDKFAGKAMLRYDQAERTEKRFIGSTEISDATIAASGFISGKYFLSYAAPVTNLVVYVQSSSGTLSGSDGKLYRQLSSDEYSYTASTGLIALSTAATTRVAAYYSGGSGSGKGGTDYFIKVDSLDCDLLYDPPDSDHTSPTLDPKLQVLCRYATTAAASSAVAYVKNVSAAKEDALFDVAIDDSGYVEVTRSGIGASSLSATDTVQRQAYRQPFAAQGYGDMAWIYTTDFDSDANTSYAPSYTRSVVVRGFSSASTITIDSNFVPGSVEVTRDGLPDYSFSVNEDTGVVTLLPAPSASEEIVVSYMREDSERKSGLLVGALGGFWDLGEGKSAWAALGSTWSVPGSSYSSGGSSSPGSVALSAGAKDTLGDFRSSLALAGRYQREDSTGLYRIEGMESSSSYATSFRYADYDSVTASSVTETYFTATERADSDLADSFPSLVSSLHTDGTTQKALKIVAGSGATSSMTAEYYKVEDSVEYDSYQTFSFYAKLPTDAALTVKLDDGAASPTTSVGIVVPAGSGDGSWKRYILHYGKGDASVYVQSSSSGGEKLLGGASSTSPAVSSSGSRLVISVSSLAAGEVAWIDEVCLSDSVGSAALLAQARASYANADWKLGPALSPILSDLAASAYAQGAYASSSYAAGGGGIKTTLSAWGFPLARLGLDASAKLSSGSPSFSGGHSITLPAASFPVQVADSFDYDPSSGAFGRSNSLALAASRIASLSASQESAWTPASSSLEAGMLLQTWKAGLSLGPSLAALVLEAKNRSWPASAPAPADSGSNYGRAWLSAYAYALPACEDSSDLREAKLSLSLKTPGAKEFFSASLGESSSPQSSTTGLRRDAAAARLSAPLALGGLAFAPYYSRSWKDKRSGKTDGMLEDAAASLGDFSAVPVLYGSIPFQEFFASSTLSDFSSQTEPSGTGLPLALYQPEAGFSLSREYGSAWYDFVLPAAMSFSYGRSLERESDTVTDDSVWSITAKLASINLFGSMGAYPIALGGRSLFDSDEYLSTLQSTYTVPRDGGATSLDLLFHGLATLHMGAADTFDLESKATVADSPSSLAWSSSLEGKLSNRIVDHWLLGLFERALASAQPKPGADGKEASVVSQYLVDLGSREANFRRTIGLTAGLSGYRSDASSYLPGYAFAESYEAKITVPERLTLKLAAAFDQSLVASTQVFTLGFELSLNVVISF